MLGIILLVLIIGALLSLIFGKRIGAMFVSGITGVAICLVGLASLAFLLILVTNGFFSESPHTESSSYSPSYGSSAAYGSSASTGSTSSYGSAPAQAYAPAAPTYSAPSSDGQTEVYRPKIGVGLGPVPAASATVMVRDWQVPPGVGVQVTSVAPGSPAAAVGLLPGDLLVTMASSGQRGEWIRPTDQLADFLILHGARVPVTLQFLRPGIGVVNTVTVTPQ